MIHVPLHKYEEWKGRVHRNLSYARLMEVISYDPNTGIFRWRVHRGGRSAGSIAGSIETKKLYRNVYIDGLGYRAHQLAFFIMTGEVPEQPDHRNTDRDDNRWENLRAASREGNAMNRKRSSLNRSGYKGVCFSPAPRAKKGWRAAITVAGKKMRLGSFATPEEAYQAYCEAAIKYHGEFARLA